MNTQANAMHEPFQREIAAPAQITVGRAFYWAVRRELWENPSLYMAPLAVAAVVLLAFSIGSILGIGGPRMRLEPGRFQMPYEMAAGVMMLTIILVSVFYCLDALHSERRDRSILFWKSLPVSDVTTVLAKASIPLIILPLIAFAVTIVLQWFMLLVSSAVLLVSGQSVGMLWRSMRACEHVATVAVSLVHGPCYLAVSHLLLAAAGVRLGAARKHSCGRHCLWWLSSESKAIVF